MYVFLNIILHINKIVLKFINNAKNKIKHYFFVVYLQCKV